MPLKKFALILLVAVAAAAATVWLGTLVADIIPGKGPSALVFSLAALALYAVWWAIIRRIGASGNDHDNHDSIKK